MQTPKLTQKTMQRCHRHAESEMGSSNQKTQKALTRHSCHSIYTPAQILLAMCLAAVESASHPLSRYSRKSGSQFLMLRQFVGQPQPPASPSLRWSISTYHPSSSNAAAVTSAIAMDRWYPPLQRTPSMYTPAVCQRGWRQHNQWLNNPEIRQSINQTIALQILWASWGTEWIHILSHLLLAESFDQQAAGHLNIKWPWLAKDAHRGLTRVSGGLRLEKVHNIYICT